jgi:hypothetical protein
MKKKLPIFQKRREGNTKSIRSSHHSFSTLSGSLYHVCSLQLPFTSGEKFKKANNIIKGK